MYTYLKLETRVVCSEFQAFRYVFIENQFFGTQYPFVFVWAVRRILNGYYAVEKYVLKCVYFWCTDCINKKQMRFRWKGQKKIDCDVTPPQKKQKQKTIRDMCFMYVVCIWYKSLVHYL